MNWTPDDANRRVHIPFGVVCGTLKELLREAGIDATARAEDVIDGGKMRSAVWLIAYGDSSVNQELIAWAVRELTSHPARTHARLMWTLDDELALRKIEIPFAQRDLNIRSALRMAVSCGPFQPLQRHRRLRPMATRQVSTAAKPARARKPAALPMPVSDQASTRVLRQFRLVFNAVKTHFQQVEKKAGVGGAQVWALSVVRDRPGVGVNDLAQAMDIRQPTASNLVKSLVAQDLIQVRKDAPDRRAVQLHLLPAGAKVLQRVPGPFAGVLPQALDSLDEATLTRLEQDLTGLLAVLGADENAAGIPLRQR